MLIRDSIDCTIDDIIGTIKDLYWNPYDEEMKAFRQDGGKSDKVFEEALEDLLDRADIYGETVWGVATKREHDDDPFYMVTLAYLDDRRQMEIYSWIVKD